MANRLDWARSQLRGATTDSARRDIARLALCLLRNAGSWDSAAAYQREVLRRYLDLLARKRMASPSFGRAAQPTIAAIVARDIDALAAAVRANREAATA